MPRRLQNLLLVLVAIALLSASSADVARAGFGYSTFGLKAGGTVPEDRHGTPTFGAYVELVKPLTNFLMLPSVMYWGTEGVRDLNANVDAYYRLEGMTTVVPFLGIGVGTHLTHSEGDTDAHLATNVLAGVRIPTQSLDWFVEGRYTSTEMAQFGLMVGVSRRP